MRENIGLFRGKINADNPNDGEWIYGSLLREGKTNLPIIVEDDTVDNDDNWINLGMWATVDPETVGEFTGLTDKNGKRIFEGDIIRHSTGRICRVTFFISPSVCGFDLVPVSNFDCLAPKKWSLFSEVEIIGNKFDNPELIERE